MSITMTRRALLHRFAATSAAGAVPAAAAADLTDAVAQFDASADRHPWLSAFKGVTDAQGDLRCEALALRGRWPAALKGRFYRNGPAVFERGGDRITHWFGGDGMVQQFTIGRGTVSHRGRLVQTTKLTAEQQAGRFLYNGFGVTRGGLGRISGPDSFNAANTNALEHGGRVLAMWEGGSAYDLDPRTLDTRGPVTWAQGLQQVPFTAHPKIDADGHLWNVGTLGDKMVAWHIGPEGRLEKIQVGQSPYPGGMVHDMAVTPRYLVVPMPPVKPNFTALIQGERSQQAIRFEADQPMRVLVMHKDDIQQRRVFELPAEMMFHVGNAHETPDGHIVLSYVGSDDHFGLVQGASTLMTGDLPDKPLEARSRTCVVRLDMTSGRAVHDALDDHVEFPRIDPRLTGLPARLLVSTARWRARSDRDPWWHAVQLHDLHTGRTERYDYGADMMVEEHIFVPKPGRTHERDSWLLGTTIDVRRQVTVLNVLDAARLSDGPIAQASLPYLLPAGFHGNFTAA